jgi:hypothetical protein
LDDDLKFMLDLFRSYNKGGIHLVMMKILSEQARRDEKQLLLDDLYARASVDPENKHGAW